MANLARASKNNARPLWHRGKSPLVSGASLEEKYAEGKSLRDKCPREAHAAWKAPNGRPGPVSAHGGIEQGTHSRAHPDSPRPHAAVAVHLLSGRGAQHGRGPGRHAGHRAARAGVRRRSPAQLRRLRHAGTARDLRHQRPGRDPPRPLGVGRETPGRQLRAGLPRQRLQRRRRPRRGARLRALLSRAHGGIQRDAGAGRVVREHRRGKTDRA